ncbi:MAG: 3-hydroxyanthranilate 3,4-dioxygenase [Lysobacteraceae bacterium]|nr:MAG: 3-hydroxyanthranilate 3,4-dioxygenase [Xanthomonadaceae bacterium]
MLTPPLNFKKWIDDHRHLLKPPVCNKVIWEDADFIAMVIGGPNARTDYHYDEGPEFFYQIEGSMTLKVVDEGEHKDIPIHAGEIFMLPPRVHHSPQRHANSIGLVIERKRLEHEQDGLIWYCQNCDELLYEEYFHLNNIEADFPPVFDRFYGSEARRTCASCGHISQTAKKA